MGAPKGNQNAKGHKGRKPEKWTSGFFANELKEIDNFIRNDKEGKFYVFIIECCLQRGYSTNRWSEMKQKFKDNVELMESVKMIEELLEVRLYKAGLANKVNSTMAIAGLNNKYRWTNKYDVDHKSDGEKINQSTVIILPDNGRKDGD